MAVDSLDVAPSASYSNPAHAPLLLRVATCGKVTDTGNFGGAPHFLCQALVHTGFAVALQDLKKTSDFRRLRFDMDDARVPHGRCGDKRVGAALLPISAPPFRSMSRRWQEMCQSRDAFSAAPSAQWRFISVARPLWQDLYDHSIPLHLS
jgi:hypothetical protein